MSAETTRILRGYRPRSPRGEFSNGVVFAAASLLPLAAVLTCICVSDAKAQESSEAPAALRFEGYPDAPEISVVPRKDELFFYPCDQCHAEMDANPEIRPLETVHHAEIQHGGGRIWCLSCHDLDDRNYLITLLNERVDFDEAYVVCGGCHSSRHKDWAFGAHGKRVAEWQGVRTQYNCTHCHDAHNPVVEARAPKPAPPARAGLELKRATRHQAAPVWQSREQERNSE